MRWADWSFDKKVKALCGTRQKPKFRNLPISDFLKVIQSWPKKPPTELNRCQFPNPIRGEIEIFFHSHFVDFFSLQISKLAVVVGLLLQFLSSKLTFINVWIKKLNFPFNNWSIAIFLIKLAMVKFKNFKISFNFL